MMVVENIAASLKKLPKDIQERMVRLTCIFGQCT
jgi:hypothetical protein